ncbi:PREDICTED: P-selectin glycoprotein ligand 1 [Aptenodytes forsteri]|uniref:P-selectin glycoprotein ligand 1 n=1 Tax=Aptenodytes forsteri TaxID=9233 RepID=UPI0004F4A93C|nr:PREDICTED: P-selectin glycoprotein ligand 1 [Aptenodytes forsteri]
MAPCWAVLVMLVLVLSTLQACGAVPPPEPGQHRGVQWVWGAAGQAQAEPLPLSRRKRADSRQQPGITTAMPGHSHAATAMPSSNDTDSPEPDLLLGSEPPPAPSTNTSLHRALAVPTTADPLDETDSPEPDLLLSSELPAAPSTNTATAAPPPADPQDETDSPDPDLLLGSVPPAEPSRQAAPQNSVTTIPSRLMSPSEEGTVASSTDSSSSVGPHSVTPPALGPTTTGYKKTKKAGAPPVPTSALWDTKPRGTAVPVPWDPSRVMGKCLLAILLLALVAATFIVCTGVLGALAPLQNKRRPLLGVRTRKPELHFAFLKEIQPGE